MEHWAYGTDDDEPPKKESDRDASSTQQHAEKKRRSADSSKPNTHDDEAVTNAPGDPSWARLEPHPENARPPPQMDPPNLQFTFAPAAVEWTPKTADEDDSYQDPRLPPGVIDISEELRWRHRERQRQSEWAQQLLARSGLFSAGPLRGPLRQKTSHRLGMPPARKPRGIMRGRPIGRPTAHNWPIGDPRRLLFYLISVCAQATVAALL